jgi:DNA-binding XRE family transcriptional regulator
MNDRVVLNEKKLAAMAKKFREEAGKTQGEAARELRVSRPAVVQAENSPAVSLSKLRRRIIEMYSTFKVVGPAYWLEKK